MILIHPQERVRIDLKGERDWFKSLSVRLLVKDGRITFENTKHAPLVIMRDDARACQFLIEAGYHRVKHPTNIIFEP